MAARTRKIRHDDNTRAKIKAAQIINRMQDCIMGKVELNQAQVSCGKALLDKCLPSLANTELTGKDGKDIFVVALPPTTSNWQEHLKK